MNLTLDLGTVLALIAVVLLLTSFLVKNMLSLRALALASNVFFIAWGYVEWVPPTLVLNGIILPLNAWYIWEIQKLTKEIAQATEDSPVSQWLLPHMTRQPFKAGEVLFRKGDIAHELVYIASGQLRLLEVNRMLGPGELIGEIGLFSSDKRRTQSVICDTDGELYRMTDEMIYRLYYQNPKLGFYVMRLIIERLLRDIQRATPSPNIPEKAAPA